MKRGGPDLILWAADANIQTHWILKKINGKKINKQLYSLNRRRRNWVFVNHGRKHWNPLSRGHKKWDPMNHSRKNWDPLTQTLGDLNSETQNFGLWTMDANQYFVSDKNPERAVKNPPHILRLEQVFFHASPAVTNSAFWFSVLPAHSTYFFLISVFFAHK